MEKSIDNCKNMKSNNRNISTSLTLKTIKNELQKSMAMKMMKKKTSTQSMVMKTTMGLIQIMKKQKIKKLNLSFIGKL